jgi:hypothetical protein
LTGTAKAHAYDAIAWTIFFYSAIPMPPVHEQKSPFRITGQTQAMIN